MKRAREIGSFAFNWNAECATFSMLLLAWQLAGNQFGSLHEHGGDAETVRSLK
jgi:hypothetical protein